MAIYSSIPFLLVCKAAGNTTAWVAEATEMHFLTVLEAGHPRPRGGRLRLPFLPPPPPPLPLAGGRPPSQCVLMWSFL